MISLTTAESALKDAYLNAGFTFLEEKIKGEWSALVMKKGEKL